MNESRNLNFQLPSIKPTPHGTGLFRPLFENTTISLEDTGKKPTPPSSEGWKIQLLFRRHRQGLNPHKTIQGWRVFTRFLWLNDFPPPPRETLAVPQVQGLFPVMRTFLLGFSGQMAAFWKKYPRSGNFSRPPGIRCQAGCLALPREPGGGNVAENSRPGGNHRRIG